MIWSFSLQKHSLLNLTIKFSAWQSHFKFWSSQTSKNVIADSVSYLSLFQYYVRKYYMFDLQWKPNASDLSFFIISHFLSNQGKIIPLILSRFKIKSYVSLPVMLLSSAKIVSLMPISLLMLESVSLTY